MMLQLAPNFAREVLVLHTYITYLPKVYMLEIDVTTTCMHVPEDRLI